MLLKELYYRKNQHILTVLSMSLALCLLIMMDNVTLNLQIALLDQIDSMGLETKCLTVYDSNSNYKNIIEKHSESYICYISESNDNYNIVGIDNNLLDFFDLSYKGRLLNTSDIIQNENKVVLGSIAYKNLEKPAIGEIVYVKGLPFEVIGVINDCHNSIFVDFDDSIIMPIGYLKSNNITSYYFKALKNIKEYLPKEGNYLLIDQSSTKQQFNIVISFVAKLLRLLSFFSFIVSSIGMLNNSLANLKTRVKEIALKRSFGASNLDIFFYLLIEDLILVIFSIITSVIVSIILIKLVDNEIVIYFDMIISRVIFIVVYSIFLGSISAYKASRITIIEALKS